MKKRRTRLARAKLRERRAKLDKLIIRRKRTVKTLARKLHRETGILSRFEAKRARLRS